MTVADLIRYLVGFPPDAPVVIADAMPGFVQEYAIDGCPSLVVGRGECPRCDGYGYDPAGVDETEDCPRCDGQGTVEGAPTVYIRLGGASGTVFSAQTIQEGWAL